MTGQASILCIKLWQYLESCPSVYTITRVIRHLETWTFQYKLLRPKIRAAKKIGFVGAPGHASWVTGQILRSCKKSRSNGELKNAPDNQPVVEKIQNGSIFLTKLTLKRVGSSKRFILKEQFWEFDSLCVIRHPVTAATAPSRSINRDRVSAHRNQTTPQHHTSAARYAVKYIRYSDSDPLISCDPQSHMRIWNRNTQKGRLIVKLTSWIRLCYKTTLICLVRL